MKRTKRRAALAQLGVSERAIEAVDAAVARGCTVSTIIECGVIHNNFYQFVMDRARDLVPEYPPITDHYDGLRAIVNALTGTELANADCHAFIGELGRRLGLTDAQVYDEFSKFHRERKEARK